MPDQFHKLHDRVRTFLEILCAKPIPLHELPDAYHDDAWLRFCHKRRWIDIDMGSWHQVSGVPFEDVDDDLAYDPADEERHPFAPHAQIAEAGRMALIEDKLAREESRTPKTAKRAGKKREVRVSALTKAQREVWDMHAEQKLSFEEIGRRRGTSKQAAKAIFDRADTKIRHARSIGPKKQFPMLATDRPA